MNQRDLSGNCVTRDTQNFTKMLVAAEVDVEGSLCWQPPAAVDVAEDGNMLGFPGPTWQMPGEAYSLALQLARRALSATCKEPNPIALGP